MATKQELQLEIQNPEYSRFVKDQVLTEVQLNEILDFMEDQHRITRTCLIGTGIVCGLNLRRDSNVVTLSAGVALTTDGDLLKMGNMRFKYFSPYFAPEKGHYDPFYYQQDGEEKMIKLYQLLTEEDKEKSTIADISLLDDLDGKLKNWVAILFLEYYLKDPEKCTPTNCDNMGIRQVAKPRVLLLTKEDMDKVIHRDTGEVIGDDIFLKYHEAYDKYFTFPVIKARRVILNKFNTLNSNTLAGAYFNAAKDGSPNLTDAIADLYSAFKFMVDKYGQLNITGITNKLRQILTNPVNTFHAQYTYDFYKDIVAAYNELREVLYNVAYECCPNLYAFPKHIMLGEPNVDYGPQPPDYRHQFYPSPAVSKNKVQVNVAIGMFQRMKLMIDNFNPDPADTAKVTPSRDYDQKIEERAIPFYYNNIRMLSKEWSYGKALKAQDKLILSYNASQYESPIKEEVLNPLDFDIDPYNFFRVEGHIGKEFKTVMKQLDEIRQTKGLPIDVVAVRLGDVKLTDINLDDFECHFEDLNTMLRAFQVEQNCLLSESSSFFSGFTPKKEIPHINLKLFVAEQGQSNWVINNALLKEPAKVFMGKAMEKMLEEDPGEPAKGFTTDNKINISTNLNWNEISSPFKTSPVLSFCDPFVKPLFTGERIVKTKIDQHPDTFGKYYLKALESDSLSVDDFMEKARTFASQDAELNQLTEDEKFVAFEYPMQIIGHLNHMQRFIPSYLGDISETMISDYKSFSKSFCRKIKIMHTRLEKHFKVGNYTSKGYETMYMNMLDNLEKACCGNEKLEVILKEIERRKTEILKSLSFARYAEDHPGMEHKAGVPRGGTFIIVYAGTGQPAKQKKTILETLGKASESKASLMEKMAGAYQYSDPDNFAYYMVSNEDTVDKEAELSNFLSFQKVSEGSIFSERLIRQVNDKITGLRQVICKELNAPEKDIVVADFCLPYLCCSTCPPVTFIIPREKKQLGLPVTRLCNIQDAIPFSIYSPKGSVVASAEAPDAVTNGDIPTFDPKKVPAPQLGKVITFTMDGEATDCTIIVTEPVVLNLGFNLKDTEGDDFSVEYLNNTDEVKYGKHPYTWKFNDGRADIQRTDTSAFSLDYSKKDLKERGIKTIEATVFVADDACNSFGTLSVPVPESIPVDTCGIFVDAFIITSLSVLNEEKFIKRVNRLDNNAVIKLYNECKIVFESAQSAFNLKDLALITKVIEQANKLLLELYNFKLTNQPDMPRVLEILLRKLLMLMLNLVRCLLKVPVDSKEIIISNIKTFLKLRSRLIKMYPQLDFANVLESEVKDFQKNFVSKDADMVSAIKELLKALKSFPES